MSLKTDKNCQALVNSVSLKSYNMKQMSKKFKPKDYFQKFKTKEQVFINITNSFWKPKNWIKNNI